MCIVLHCRILFWCTSSLYTSWYTPLYISFLTCTLMWCLSGSLQNLDGELTINYQPILFQANLLSCLSSTVGLVHEPPLPNGVVNLQHYYGISILIPQGVKMYTQNKDKNKNKKWAKNHSKMIQYAIFTHLVCLIGPYEACRYAYDSLGNTYLI